MDIEIQHVVGVAAVLFTFGVSFALTINQLIRLRTWWRNRGWRAGMQIRLDEVRKEYDQMEEFTLSVKEGLAGRGLLKGTLAVTRSDKEFLIRFLEDGLQEIEEEGREIERAIREL